MEYEDLAGLILSQGQRVHKVDLVRRRTIHKTVEG